MRFYSLAFISSNLKLWLYLKLIMIQNDSWVGVGDKIEDWN
jgi:hypothetical protein